MEEVIVITVFGVVFFTFLGIFSPNSAYDASHERIARALGRVEAPLEESLTFAQRVIKPLFNSVAAIFSRMSPNDKSSPTAKKLAAAGLAGQWDSSEWKALQFGLGILSGTIIFVLLSLGSAAYLKNLVFALIGILFGYLLTDSWLKAKIRSRQTEIQDTLPDVLDLLTVSVEAGLGFDAALLKVSEKQKGVLGQEFLRLLQEINLGRPRREALRDMSKRLQVDDLRSFISSLVQADQLGISIGGVLRNQSGQMRQKRRQRSEEKAQKAPIKMMIPLVFFIFPCIFIVTLGPVILSLMESKIF